MVGYVAHFFYAFIEDVYGCVCGGPSCVPFEEYVPWEILFFPPEVVSRVVVVEGFLCAGDDGVVCVLVVYAWVVVGWCPVVPRGAVPADECPAGVVFVYGAYELHPV